MTALKWVLRIVGGLIGLMLVLGLVGYAYVSASYDKDYASYPNPKIQASKDPAVIARGEYLANAVAHCSACHGPADAAKARTLGPRHDLRGGYRIEAEGFGTFVPANITPDKETGIGNLSDAQLARVIRTGIAHTGKLSTFMTFVVGPMSYEDLTAVVSYLRSVPAVKNATPPNELGPVAKVLMLVLEPRKSVAPTFVKEGGISVERGRYLANGPAYCFGCHTPTDPFSGFQPSGPTFSGEAHAEPDMTDPKYEIVVPNLTPDPKTGVMTAWTEDAFLQRIRNGRVYADSKMPWENFAQMTDEDLRSIYRYLRTVPAVEHDVGPSRRPVGWSPEQ